MDRALRTTNPGKEPIMKRACIILVLGLLLAPAAAQAKRSDFIGTWLNDNPGAEIAEIRVTSTYQVYVNKVTYGGVLVSYGTSGAPDGHTTASIVLRSGARTTTLVIGLGTLVSPADTTKLWGMKLVDQSNYNSDGNTHTYLVFRRLTFQKPVAPGPLPIAP
jgi:hypothetical protein